MMSNILYQLNITCAISEPPADNQWVALATWSLAIWSDQTVIVSTYLSNGQTAPEADLISNYRTDYVPNPDKPEWPLLQPPTETVEFVRTQIAKYLGR